MQKLGIDTETVNNTHLHHFPTSRVANAASIFDVSEDRLHLNLIQITSLFMIEILAIKMIE